MWECCSSRSFDQSIDFLRLRLARKGILRYVNMSKDQLELSHWIWTRKDCRSLSDQQLIRRRFDASDQMMMMISLVRTAPDKDCLRQRGNIFKFEHVVRFFSRYLGLSSTEGVNRLRMSLKQRTATTNRERERKTRRECQPIIDIRQSIKLSSRQLFNREIPTILD